ncbi:hypothetical protein [Helicobacter apodemus]|uniref:Uncharacterized protein n=1 Tax=Helicobacter apodemus TaxID=135569 RepID=A0A2U8FD13_9HELI|nr:hypothetical protein [Helicobacter apodemus]AWI33727.1 hypothetical protein CDV25_02345 [Helicobacter apodemus]AWI34184.1 hypothetical protein CDV25_04940 [Helicobacter apodemus]AWI34706.1 hypothetical protein CDV25_07955 [Helicobacter apodemus]
MLVKTTLECFLKITDLYSKRKSTLGNPCSFLYDRNAFKNISTLTNLKSKKEIPMKCKTPLGRKT